MSNFHVQQEVYSGIIKSKLKLKFIFYLILFIFYLILFKFIMRLYN